MQQAAHDFPARPASAGPLPNTLALQLSGLHCASCVARVEQSLLQVPGVATVSVNLATQKALIAWTGATPPTAALLQAVANAGYEAQAPACLTEKPPADSGSPPRSPPRSAISGLPGPSEGGVLILCIGLCLPLLWPMLAHLWGLPFHWPAWLQCALTMPVMGLLGLPMLHRAWHSLRQGVANMDTLVSLGAWSALGLSLYLWLGVQAAPQALYFESAAVVLTLVSLGQWLEARARQRTTQALRALEALRPTRARVIRAQGEQEIALEELQLGDTLVWRPGERCPTDATVMQGHSLVDESLITGESMPQPKGPGDPVVGASMNGNGLLLLKVRALGTQTALAHIIQMVETAQAHKPPIQRRVDQISAVFVPVVLMLAGLTLAFWLAQGLGWNQAFMVAVSVLVVACPCALGIATPAAIVTGTGQAARLGILVKDASAFEMLGRIKTMVFDKTGTLTLGQPRLLHQLAAKGVDTGLLLAWAASLQQGSQHPLAQATRHAWVQWCAPPPGERGETSSEPQLQASGWLSFPGQGMEAMLGETLFRLGRPEWLLEQGMLAPEPALKEASKAWLEQGLTVSWLARQVPGQGLEALGVLAYGDAMKPEAPQALEALRALGIELALLSGDQPQAVNQLARELRIEKQVAHAGPQEKARLVAAMGPMVAMAGDGVNDAPALAAATVGIAMGSGTDVAIQTAGITLLRGDLQLLPKAIALSRRIQQKIWQNLLGAFLFNGLGLSLAMMGRLTPMWAAAAMAASSLAVVLNSLWLQKD
jgi:Cu+-exporting ATPase